MRSVLQTLGLSTALSTALALSAAFAFAQETAPGSTAPDPSAASTPGANAPASNEAASGAPAAKSDWPCEQVQRPEISVGSVWHGPDPEGAADTDWRGDQAVAALVEQIAPRRMPQDQAIDAVHRFSAGYKDDREKVLTAVFAGLFETMSQERSQIIQGIKHFNGRQDSLAQRIQEGWKQLDALDPSSPDPKIAEQRMTLQQTIDWDSRVFDDREHLLPVICQQPTVIEQRLFALSRAIQEDMKAP